MDVNNPRNIGKTTVSISYETCQACCDEYEVQNLVAMPCNHYWCHDCLSRTCLYVRNENDLPLSCGETCNIPYNVALNNLPPEEGRLFEKRLEELNTPTRERYYCANKDCGEFIPSNSQGTDNLAVCHECAHSTCKSCRALQHDGDCEGPSEEDNQAFALIKKEGYQTCSECDRVVERTQGCSHMTCYCGYDFCYHCGGPIKTCNGCGHLEPDSDALGLAQFPDLWTAADTATPEFEAVQFIQDELIILRPHPRPVSPDSLTGWFMHRLLTTGYGYYTFFLRANWTVQFVKGAGDMPTPEELTVSDAMIFSLFETAYVVLHDDGTADIVPHETDEERERNDQQDGEESGWDM